MAKKYTDEEQKLRDSLTGSSFDKQYFTTDELQSAADIVKAASEGTTDWQSAHDYVEGIRGNYGYSGGKDGSQYIQTSKPVKYTPGYVQSYGSLPSYVSQNQDAIDNALNAILNREAFSYDYSTDPRWQAYKKEYTREGQRATADALGQYAAATGGMPSTAAMTAATQAGDYYAAQMTDKIPELYQLAYAMYQDEGSNLRNNLSMLMDKENMDYSKYLTDLEQYNRDRGFDYDAWWNDKNFGYQQDRDAIGDSRYESEWNYQLERDKAADDRQLQSDALGRVQDYLAAGGKASALDPELIAQSGLSPAEVQAYENYYAQQAKGSSGGGSRRSGYSGGNDSMDFDSEVDRDQALFDEASKHTQPEDWISDHYKDYGYSTAAGAKAAYKALSEGNAREFGEGLSDRGFLEVRRMISQNLQQGNTDAVEATLNNIESQVNEEQWDAIVEILDNFGIAIG